jgi:CBS domain-containing protein
LYAIHLVRSSVGDRFASRLNTIVDHIFKYHGRRSNPGGSKMKTIRQVLEAKGYDVYVITPDELVFDALCEMATRNVGALLVLEGGEIVGIVSERDYARKVILKNKASKHIPVREIMSSQVVCVGPEQKVDACMALMTEKHIRHLAVMENRNLIGVISIGDVVKAIIDQQQFTIEQLEHYISGGR